MPNPYSLGLRERLSALSMKVILAAGVHSGVSVSFVVEAWG